MIDQRYVDHDEKTVVIRAGTKGRCPLVAPPGELLRA
jgi:hypothetical protein